MASQAAASADETVTTYGHQDDLQSLPVPDLEDTLKKYLVTVKPFLTPEEMEHTEAVVEDFKNGIGAKLQEMLVARGEEERNWLEDWWENLWVFPEIGWRGHEGERGCSLVVCRQEDVRALSLYHRFTSVVTAAASEGPAHSLFLTRTQGIPLVPDSDCCKH